MSVTTSKKNRPNSSLSEASSSDTGGSYSQKTLEETYELKKIWDINSSQAQKIHFAIGEMIALDSQPFSIVEDVGFKRLMKVLKPNYELPSRKYFTSNIIPTIYSRVGAKIKKSIDQASNLSFTTDIWTNNANASFIRYRKSKF